MVASYIAPMRDAGEQVKVDEVIHKTILMKKNSFYEYRWLFYVWVCEPKTFFALISNTPDAMDLKRRPENAKVEKAIR